MASELEGRLISRSCTTGWLDMVHGELWLFDDGILRVRLDFAATMENGMGPTVTAEPTSKRFGDAEREALVGARRTNIFIGWGEVVDAQLRRGIVCGRLRVKLRDGTSRKLLWLTRDCTHQPLVEALASTGHGKRP